MLHDHIINPVAGGLFGKRPSEKTAPVNKLEATYKKIDNAFDELLSLLAA